MLKNNALKNKNKQEFKIKILIELKNYLGGGEILLDCGGGDRPRLATSGL